MSRDDFSASDKRLLAERVGFHCSNPSCGVSTIAASDIPDKIDYVGVAAHIYSASRDKGPRANPSLTAEQRKSIDNGIHLCNKCSTIIDKNNGEGYPAEVLHGWKRSAEAKAKERIYENRSYTVFKKVDFLNLEKKYSTALTCSGLTEKNVTSCPSNKPLITTIKNNLVLANKCILKGVSGSGKSLLTFQTAYELHKNGWSVYNLNKESVTNSLELAAPQKKSVILIDDAQILNSHTLENILNNSYEDCFVLANWNTNISIDENFLKKFPCVDVIPSSQVELLKSYCLKNKEAISETLISLGINLDYKDYSYRIETRIERAAKEKTPWLFNYSLTEGWRKANNDFKLLKGDEDLHLVIVTVAIYQIATLDFGVSKEVILSSLSTFKNDSFWLKRASNILDDTCLMKNEFFKNKHYEYSRKILKIFTTQDGSNEEKLYLISVLKNILKSSDFEKGHSTILEFIKYDFDYCTHKFREEGFTEEISKDIFEDNHIESIPVSRVMTLYSLIRFSKTNLEVMKLNASTLEKWIFNCNKDTAYAFGSLFNELHNARYLHFPSSKSLVNLLMTKTINSELEDKYQFSYMFNRAFLLLGDNEKTHANKKLANSNFNLNFENYSSNKRCFQFSALICHLSCINPNWANQQIKNNIPNIAAYLNSDLMKAYYSIHELIDSYFGVVAAILGIKIKDSKLKKRGRELTKLIEIESILKGFDKLDVIDVQNYGNILILLALYNRSKLAEVSDLFNYQKLEELYCKDSVIDHHHKAIISILRNPASENYMGYLSKVITSSASLDRGFFEIAPELSIEQLKAGAKYNIKFHDCSKCSDELLILQYIQSKGNKSMVERIVFENELAIAKSIFSKSQNVDNKKGKFDLLIFIYVNFPIVLKNIFNNDDENNQLFEKVYRLLKGNKHEKMISRLYIYFIKKFGNNIPEEISSIEKKYPSVRGFDINEYT